MSRPGKSQGRTPKDGIGEADHDDARHDGTRHDGTDRDETRRDGTRHVDDRLQACLDGELAPDEAAAVRAHCESCPRCARAWRDLTEVWEALGVVSAPQPPRAVWPLVQARLSRRPSRFLRISFALGATAAAVGGLMLGVLLGSAHWSAEERWQQETWAEVGSLLADGAEPTLDEIYLAAGLEEGEEAP
jgi:anti-sigma factor RsiW